MKRKRGKTAKPPRRRDASGACIARAAAASARCHGQSGPAGVGAAVMWRIHCKRGGPLRKRSLRDATGSPGFRGRGMLFGNVSNRRAAAASLYEPRPLSPLLYRRRRDNANRKEIIERREKRVREGGIRAMVKAEPTLYAMKEQERAKRDKGGSFATPSLSPRGGSRAFSQGRALYRVYRASSVRTRASTWHLCYSRLVNRRAGRQRAKRMPPHGLC